MNEQSFFGPGNVLTVTKAQRKVEAHGFACVFAKGLRASVRRACAAQMQMPTGSGSETSLACTAVIPNVPGGWLQSWLQSLGWSLQPTADYANGWSRSRVVVLTTDYPKAIGEMLHLESLDTAIGFAGSKLYKPVREPKAKAMLAALPPGRVVHRIRGDGSEIVEITFHLGVINEVKRMVALPHSLSTCMIIVCQSDAVCVCCRQYGRMEVSARHRKKGRLIMDFSGYHPEDEEELFKYLKKSLRTIVENHPGQVTDSLRRVVQPNWVSPPPPSA